MRTNDRNVILADLNNIKNFDLGTFQHILEIMWEVKAKGIFELATRKEYKTKEVAYKESRRLKEINQRDISDLFSPAQLELVQRWSTRFRNAKLQGCRNAEEVLSVVENLVMPWLLPYMYSKCTMQDGCKLALEVALRDFCILANVS